LGRDGGVTDRTGFLRPGLKALRWLMIGHASGFRARPRQRIHPGYRVAERLGKSRKGGLAAY